jgi:uncharacterized protein
LAFRQHFLDAMRRVRGGLLAAPSCGQWQQSALIGLAGLAACWVIGLASGLYHWQPKLDWSLVQIALIAFLVPAVGEEVVFRGAMIPLPGEPGNGIGRVCLSTLAYLAWHPLNAALFFPDWLAYFSDIRFLVVTAILGLTCAVLWRRTGSLWPPVLLHWIAVAVWKGFLGAPA